MLFRIEHETKLVYSTPVTEHVFEARMAPLSDEDQTTLGYRLRVTPSAPITSYRDGFGNRVDLFSLSGQNETVAVAATSYVRTHRRPVAARLRNVNWPDDQPAALEAMEYLQPSPLIDQCPQFTEFLSTLPKSLSGPLAGGVQQIMNAVRKRLKYEKTVTTSRSAVSEALELGSGVCQDFAHLLIGACRGCGLPARYVSGYIHQPGELATHAWVQIWGGGSIGWIDVDPTHDRFTNDDYIVTALGRDFSDVPPNRGAFKGQAEETISVAVRVESVSRLPADWTELESPSARKPQAQMQTQGVRFTRVAGLSNQTVSPPSIKHQQSQQQ